MTFFTYNGVNSASFGLRIESKSVFSAPAFDAEFQSIPGRSGDLIIPNNRFANLTVTYTVFLARRTVGLLSDTLRAIKGWLYTQPDRYHPITDSYDTGFTRYGVIKEGLDIEEQLNRVGYFTVTFSCKPFRYSDAGQVSEDVRDGGILYNPEAFPSRPLFTLEGSGQITLTIQNSAAGYSRSWTFSDFGGSITGDSELMNFYNGTILLNHAVIGEEFPLLYPGENVLSWVGDVTALRVTPRWCAL